MKKTLLLVAILLLLTACGHKEAPTVTLANPMSASSLQAMEEETGHPTDTFRELSDLAVTRYALDPVLYQLEFTGADGLVYTFRVTCGDEETDISGMYFSWTETAEEDGCTVHLDDQGHGICLWQEGNYAYSLAMETNASFQTLTAMRTQLMK